MSCTMKNGYRKNICLMCLEINRMGKSTTPQRIDLGMLSDCVLSLTKNRKSLTPNLSSCDSYQR